MGSKKNPIWRVVVADQRSPRDGRFIETIGHYNPQTNPSTILIDEERFEHWVSRGAQPTGTVKKLMVARSRGGAPAAAEPAAGTAVAEPAVPADEPAPAAEEPAASEEPAAEAPAAEAEAAPEAEAASEADAPAEPEAAEAPGDQAESG